MRKYEGIWHLERQLLFPGNIFLESNDEEIPSEEIEKWIGIVWQKFSLIRLGKREEDFLKKLCKDEHHLEMSKGVICKGNTQITEGPLKGLENRIDRIDRHKRLARVDIAGNPGCCYITAGLEITEKIV